MDLRLGVDGRSDDVAVPAHAGGDVLLADREHAARSAARVIHRPDDAGPPDARVVAGQHEVHHEMHDVARGEVFAGILVERLVELPDELLEDRAHRRVVDHVRVQVDVLEALEHLEQEPSLVQPADGVVDVELLQHLAHVRAEAGEVVPQIGREVRRVGEELGEVVARGVVKREAGGLPKLRVEVLELLASQLSLLAQDLLLGRGQHTIESPQDRKRKDDVLVLAPLEGVTDEVGDAPEEADDLTVIHLGWHQSEG